jgi:hypothetical protein
MSDIEIVGTKEAVVKELTRKNGDELQLMSNISNGNQIPLVLESAIFNEEGFDSPYVRNKVEILLRMTVGHKGRGRTDLVEIGKTPEVSNGFMGFGGNSCD